MSAGQPQAIWKIYSREHNAFWRANEAGYTPHLDQAGLYTFVKALEICGRANVRPHIDGGPNEFAIFNAIER